LIAETALSIISAGVEPAIETQTLVKRERRNWEALPEVFNLIVAIAYITEQLSGMQLLLKIIAIPLPRPEAGAHYAAAQTSSQNCTIFAKLSLCSIFL
jgi:hypothetical protein